MIAANDIKELDIGGTCYPITYRKVSDLRAYDRNARIHPKRQIETLRRAIRTYGFIVPVAVHADDLLLAGHGRIEAAGLEGLDMVPVIDMSALPLDKARAFALADNRISDMAGWDMDILRGEIAAIRQDHAGLNLADLALGFTDAQLGSIAASEKSKNAKVEKKSLASTPEQGTLSGEDRALAGPAVCAIGNVWDLGAHRLGIGDSMDAALWRQVLDGDRIGLLFADPPYGVDYGAKAKDLNKRLGKSGNEDDIENDELKGDDLEAFLVKILVGLLPEMEDRAAHYVCTAPGDLSYDVARAMLAAGFPIETAIGWAKNHLVMGRADYHYQHEIIFYGARSANPWFKGPPDASSLWEFNKPNRSKLHPTMKPPALVEQAIRYSLEPGGIVADPFGGSGTTLIAAERSGRCARLVELSAQYGDRILRRWRLETGLEPVRSDGKTLSEIELDLGYEFDPDAGKG